MPTLYSIPCRQEAVPPLDVSCGLSIEMDVVVKLPDRGGQVLCWHIKRGVLRGWDKSSHLFRSWLAEVAIGCIICLTWNQSPILLPAIYTDVLEPIIDNLLPIVMCI